MIARMSPRVGDEVHVPGIGTGVVREVRNRGRCVVEIKGRAMVVEAAHVEAAASRSRPRRAVLSSAPRAGVRSGSSIASLDLHGMTVEQAIEILDRFLSDALVAGHAEVRVIHGKSGGRIKAAVHARLRELPAVRHFRVDATNAGVTIVVF